MTEGELRNRIETLFRREAGRLISVLTRLFGPRNLELAEDVLQESFVAAMDTWSVEGIPDNPAAWLLTTARNRAVDAIRRERTRRTFAADLGVYLDSEWTLTSTVNEAFDEDLIRDDQLRMIFMCCDGGELSQENRITLILKTLCGLSVPAIARALLTTESTINKRLYRTRQRLEGAAFSLPVADELTAALETVAAGRYHLEAAIAARHCSAATFEETDWPSICNLYDHLLEVAPSPVTELNRAVAISYRDTAAAAIPLVEAIRKAGNLPHTHTVAAVLANLYARAGSPEPARTFLAEALARAQTDHERDLIRLQVQRAQG